MGFTIASVMPAKKPAQNAFGKRLVALRQQRGLTQVQLAKATGMTQRAISYYETEAELPASAALITLAKVLEAQAAQARQGRVAYPRPGDRAALEEIPAHGIAGRTRPESRHPPD
jgi:transcriptional regulator with XRE-family HTH domain